MGENVRILERANELITLAGVPIVRDLKISHAHRFFNAVGDAYRALEKGHLPHWVAEWAPQFRALVDAFDKEAERDPMIQYVPAHAVAEMYHASWARWLYAKCANATGKTQMGLAEDYRILTHQDPYGKYSDTTPNMALCSLEYTGYGGAVFEAKLLNGETNNFLSPMFPDGGKWLHKYDAKNHKIWIKCPKCANAKNQPMCHEPVWFRHYSQETGWEGFQGATYAAVHIDEHVEEELFDESLIRTERGATRGRIFVTGTPLFGLTAWEIVRLQNWARSNPEHNWTRLEDGRIVPLVEVLKITQAAAGFKTPEQVEEARRTLSKSKFRARWEGEEIPDVKNAVFEDELLEEQEGFCRVPEYGLLEIREYLETDPEKKPILQGPYDPEPGAIVDDLGLDDPTHLRWIATSPGKNPETWSGYRIWEKPKAGEQYIMGVDVSAGLSQEAHDASCCQVFKVVLTDDGDLCLEQVAQIYGWINPLKLAPMVKRIGVYYNKAIAVVEITGGLGQSHVYALKELGYPAIFRNTRDPAMRDHDMDPRHGVDTNIKTKPMFIAACVNLMRDGRLKIRDKETIFEMRLFVQHTTDGGTVKYQAADSAHDDRVTSLLFPCFALVHQPLSCYALIEPDTSQLTREDIAKHAIDKATRSWDPFADVR